MDLFLAISQGIGVSLATGMRSFLPPLLVCALARGNVGVDFEGTDYGFLESVAFLLVLLLLNVAGVLFDRMKPMRSLEIVFLPVAAVLGALLFAGSLDEEGYTAFPGWLAGPVCVLVAYAAVQTFLGGARARLAGRGQEESAAYLNLYAAGAALCLAALAVVIPPASYIVLGFFGWVLLESRRRGSRKYEGLRVLR
jgi:hypothetical protein